VQGTVRRPAASGLLAFRLACSQFVVGSAESVHFRSKIYKTDPPIARFADAEHIPVRQRPKPRAAALRISNAGDRKYKKRPPTKVALRSGVADFLASGAVNFPGGIHVHDRYADANQ
jgi:hypothetical protein